jgi:hypothetical protein
MACRTKDAYTSMASHFPLVSCVRENLVTWFEHFKIVTYFIFLTYGIPSITTYLRGRLVVFPTGFDIYNVFSRRLISTAMFAFEYFRCLKFFCRESSYRLVHHTLQMWLYFKPSVLICFVIRLTSISFITYTTLPLCSACNRVVEKKYKLNWEKIIGLIRSKMIYYVKISIHIKSGVERHTHRCSLQDFL